MLSIPFRSLCPFADLRDIDSWIRCWSASNSGLAEDCLTLSRLRHLMLETDHVFHQIVSLRLTPIVAANVVLCMCRSYCRGSTWSNQSSATMREVLLNDRRVVRATREDNTRCDTFNTWMTHANTLLLLTQTAIQGCAVTSLVGTRSVSVCAVSRSVIHGVLRSQTIPQPTRLVSHVLQGTCTRPE